MNKTVPDKLTFSLKFEQEVRQKREIWITLVTGLNL